MRKHPQKLADFCEFQMWVKAGAGGESAQCGLCFLGDAVEFGACRLGRRTFQLTAGGHDVAPERGEYRRRHARLDNQAAERATPFGRRTFIPGNSADTAGGKTCVSTR